MFFRSPPSRRSSASTRRSVFGTTRRPNTLRRTYSERDSAEASACSFRSAYSSTVSLAYMRLGLRSCFFCVISARLSFLGRSTKRRIGNAGGNALLPGPGQRALASIVREKAQRAADCTYRRLDGNPRQWVCRTSACLSRS